MVRTIGTCFSLCLMVALTANAAEKATATSATVEVTTASAKKFSLHAIEDQLIRETNAQRARYGLAPLAVCENLMQSARSHTIWMCRSGSLQHTRAQVAENIALGQRSTPEAIQSWMNSPGHRANMLSGRYSRMGAAAYTASNGRIFWCLQFLH